MINKLYLSLLFVLGCTCIIYGQQTEPPATALTTAGNLIVYQVKDSLVFKDLLTGQPLYTIPLPTDERLQILAFNPSGTELVFSGKRQLSTYIYQVRRDQAKKITELPFWSISLAFSHSGEKAYLLCAKKILRARLAVYDTRTWKRIDEGVLKAVSGDIGINANDSLIVYRSVGTIKTNTLPDLQLDKVLWERAPQKLIALNPVIPEECASVTPKNTIEIRDLRKDSILVEIKSHGATIRMLSYRPDGKMLLSLDKSGKLCVWSLEKKTLVAEWNNASGLPFWDSTGNLRMAFYPGSRKNKADPSERGDQEMTAVIPLKEPGEHRGFQEYHAPKVESFFSPSFGYTPETGFAPGLGEVLIAQPRTKGLYYRPSVYRAAIAYGFRGNQALATLSINSYIKDKWNLLVNADYDGHGQNYYFGIGDTSGRKDKQTYHSSSFVFTGNLFRLAGRQLSVGIGYDLRYSTRIRFEDPFDPGPPGLQGGLSMGVGPSIRLDSRNNTLSPSSGHLLDLSWLRYGPGGAGDYHYNELKLNYRQYFPLCEHEEHRLIAVQAMTDLTWGGEIPFYSLPYYTAERAFRGVYRNLYIDKQILFLQTEFRSLFTRADPRYGYVIFAGAADGAGDFFKGYKPDIKMLYGLGLRQQLFPKHRLLLRIDLAWTNKGDFGVFGAIGTSF